MRKIILLTIFAMTFCLLLSMDVLGADIYVRASAVGAGTGVASDYSNAMSLANAIGASQVSGNTYHLYGETYTGDMLFNGKAPASATTYIADSSAGTGIPIIVSSATASLYVLNSTNLVIDGLTFQPVAGDYCVWLRDNGTSIDNVTIQNCTMTGQSDAQAIVLTADVTSALFDTCTFTGAYQILQAAANASAAADVTFNECDFTNTFNTNSSMLFDFDCTYLSAYFTDCTIAHTGSTIDYGIWIEEGANFTVSGCTITFGGDSAAVMAWDKHTTNATPSGDITGNIIYKNNIVTASAAATGIKAWATNVATKIEISGNYVTGATYGIEVEGAGLYNAPDTSEGAWVLNNRCVADQYGIVIKTSDFCLVENNSVYGDGGATDAGIYMKGAQKVLVQNNTISNFGYGLYLYKATGGTDWDLDGATPANDRNSTGIVYYNNAIAGAITVFQIGDASQLYTADYNCYSGNTGEANGVNRVPAVNTDGKVTSSNCKNTGTPLLVKSDGTILLYNNIGIMKSTFSGRSRVSGGRLN